ncbi:MAG: hypothetical protein GY929_03525 [Actinomycetia bacterium]|nr:hypothetical protein [Actinomycetes bacterium]
MSVRPIKMSLLLAVALLAGACSSGGGEVTATEGGGSGNETPTTIEGNADTDEESSDTDSTEGESNDPLGGDKEPADDDVESAGSDGEEGDPTEDPETALTEFIVGEVPVEVEKCVVTGILDDGDLFAATVGLSPSAEMTDLELDDQLALLELSVDCAGPELFGQFMAEGFAEGSGMAPPDGMSECFAAEFASSDGPPVMAGLVAVGNGVPANPKVRGPVIDALTECVPASFVTEAVVVELAADPTFEDAADLECIDLAYAEATTIEPLWAAYVDAPTDDFSDMPPEVAVAVFGPLFNCISFGAVMAAEAAADGVDLSAQSVACIDQELAGAGLFEAILAGQEPDEAVLAAAILGCLTPEELLQMTS